MTWQAAHSWKEESAKSGVMLFNAAAAYGLNIAVGYRDRESAQTQTDPLTIRRGMQFGSAENEKVWHVKQSSFLHHFLPGRVVI